jgi:hypothetical protein
MYIETDSRRATSPSADGRKIVAQGETCPGAFDREPWEERPHTPFCSPSPARPAAQSLRAAGRGGGGGGKGPHSQFVG